MSGAISSPTGMQIPPVACADVGFSYDGARFVLTDIDLTVQPGEVVGLLGPNGAGKTTLIRLLAGLVRPQRGTVRVLGVDPFTDLQVHQRVGVMHQIPGFEQFLSVWDNLRIYARFLSIGPTQVRRRVDELSSLFGIADLLKQPVIGLSGGQRRRVQLIRALLRDPDVLFIDEPTAGLDVEARHNFYTVVQRLIAELATTVIWTSHYLEEIERNCRRVVFVVAGRLVRDAPVRELHRLSETQEVRVILGNGKFSEQLLSSLKDLGCDAPQEDEIRFIGKPADFYQIVLPRLMEADVHIQEIAQRRPGLEEVYLDIVRQGSP